MPKTGDVLFYEDYEYDDGSKSDKLFIVIFFESVCLLLKTTKNDRFYRRVKEGCNPARRVFFIPADKKEFFHVDTYVQLPEIIELTISDLLKGSFSKQIKSYESALSLNLVQLIKECLQFFREDISPRHWGMIFPDRKNAPSHDSIQKLAMQFSRK